MATTTTTIRNNPEATRVEAVTDGGEIAGFAAYTLGDGVYDFHHTEVGDEYGGQGIGSQLVKGALDLAREEGARVRPTCPFIRSYVAEHEDTHDLLADGVEL